MEERISLQDRRSSQGDILHPLLRNALLVGAWLGFLLMDLLLGLRLGFLLLDQLLDSLLMGLRHQQLLFPLG